MEKRSRRRANEEEEEEEKPQSSSSNLLECGELILPWLDHKELASIASTCKTLSLISKSISSLRSSDASRSFETLPIPFFSILNHPPYSYFIYTPSLTLNPNPIPIPLGVFRQRWGSRTGSARSVSCPGLTDPSLIRVEDAALSGCGCDCIKEEEKEGRCDRWCPCSGLDSGLTRECGVSCGCGSECGNRVTQRGVSVRVKIVRDGRKGWGLHAHQFIKTRQFVCEYAGEVLTTKEARKRQQIYDELTSSSGGRFSSALLVVREHLPSGKACMRVNIDATRIGNVARFINHSCDGGNLSTVLVRSAGALLPRLCFFASRDIQEDEELTFSYGDVRIRPNGLECFCGSSCCLGMLPSEHT